MNSPINGRFCQNTKSQNKGLGQLIHKILQAENTISILLLKSVDKEMAQKQIQAYK